MTAASRIRTLDGLVIVTEHWPPPIPLRQYDWSAALDSYEQGDPYGHGATEGDAVLHLLAQLEERE